MPDGDVFDRNGRRGWQTASQRMIGGGENCDALPAALRALGRDLRAQGCPGFDGIVSVVVGAPSSAEPQTARRLALAQLECIRVQHGARITQLAIDSARRLLAGGFDQAVLTMDDCEQRVHFSTAILADIADASMCPAVLLPKLVEAGSLSFKEFHRRRQQSKELIAAAAETRRMAIQLLAEPSGASVKAPRMRRERLSQAQILATPLTL